MINLTFILRLPKGRCYGKQLTLGANKHTLLMPPKFVALAFQKGLNDRSSYFKILNGNDF